MNIALIDLSLNIGGGQIALYNIANSLSNRGHNVELIIGNMETPKRLEYNKSNNFIIHKLHGYSNYYDLIKIENVMKRKILKLSEEKKFDVIHAHGASGVCIPRSNRDKFILTIHGNSKQRLYNLMHYSIKNIYMRRALLNVPFNFLKNVLGHSIQSDIEKKMCKNAHKIISLTETEKKYIKIYYNILDDKISVIPNIIINPENNEIKLDDLKDKKILLSVGSLSLIKGIPILIEAIMKIFSLNEEAILISAGDGPLMPLMNELKNKYPKRVIIHRYISNLKPYYQNSTALIHSSIFEAFSLAIGEAMIEGIPVIANDTSSIPEVVINNFNGLLCETGNPKDMAEKSLKILNDDQFATKLGINGKKFINNICNKNKIVLMLEKTYKEIGND